MIFIFNSLGTAFFFLTFCTSRLIKLPENTAFFPSKNSWVFGKPQKIFSIFLYFAKSLFVEPGIEFCSWIYIGPEKCDIPTKETYPPKQTKIFLLEKILKI